MKPILKKYNISEERSQEIFDNLQEIEDFSLNTPIDETKNKVLQHLNLFQNNEIEFIKEIIDETIKIIESNKSFLFLGNN